MKKRYPLSIAFLCAMFFAFVTQAQDMLWGIWATNDGGALYSIYRDGSGYQALASFHETHDAGYMPNELFRASDGTVYGVNTYAAASAGGRLYKVAHDGGISVVLPMLDYAVGSNAHLAEGRDGYIYLLGPGASPYTVVLTRCRPDGSDAQRITVGLYGFRPLGGLVKSRSGTLFGLAYGGANGFLYRIRADFSGIDIVYTFARATGNGPSGELVEGPDGFLYGTTRKGGMYNNGVVFKVSQDGTQYQKLYDFKASVSGKTPMAGLVLDGSGNLYGVTSIGGAYGFGTIFRITTSGAGFIVLHHFTGGVNGAYPNRELLLDQQKLYGYARNTTAAGDMIFSVNADGTGYTPLHQLGHAAQGRLLRVPTANQPLPYLTTPPDNAIDVSVSGWFRTKTIAGATSYTLQLSKSSDFAVLAAEQTSDTRDFNIPGIELSTTYYARVRSNLSSEFGFVTSFTTRSAAAYAFVTKPADGSADVPVVNVGITANKVPNATHYTIEVNTASDFSGTSIVQRSTFSGERTFNFGNFPYGATYYARVKTELSPLYGRTTTFTTRQETFPAVISPAPGADTATPTLLALEVEPVAGGKRYTVEISSDPSFGSGTRTLQSISDNQTKFVAKDLAAETTYYTRVRSDISSNWGPTRSLTTRALNGAWRLWGVTANGGTYGRGTIFSFSIDSASFNKSFDYNPVAGEEEYYHMRGHLVQAADGRLYGTVAEPGFSYGSTLFGFTPDGTYSPVDQGANYGAATLASDGKLYITNDDFYFWRGGIYYHEPSVSSWSSITGRIIFRFSNSDWGRDPYAAVTELNGYLYGVAATGGSLDIGTIYRLRADGSGFQVLHHFDNVTGSGPVSAMVDGNDGFLYGMTPSGGPGGGVIFKIRPDGSGVQAIHHFNGANGSDPRGSLVKVGSALYGLTKAGGSNGFGVLFRIQTDGTGFSILHHFARATGSAPAASLTVGKAGEFYGTTSLGGVNDAGVLFRYSELGGYSALFHFSDQVGSNPETTLVLAEETYGLAGGEMARNASAPRVYPNPFLDEFTAEVERHTGETVRLVVTDLQGNVRYDHHVTDDQAIRLGNKLDRGIYLLKIWRGSEVSVHRMVKM